MPYRFDSLQKINQTLDSRYLLQLIHISLITVTLVLLGIGISVGTYHKRVNIYSSRNIYFMIDEIINDL